MATLSITVPDAVATRVMDAIGATYGFAAALAAAAAEDPPRTLTKAQFAKQVIIDFVRTTVKNYEAELARAAAAAQTGSDITLA